MTDHSPLPWKVCLAPPTKGRPAPTQVRIRIGHVSRDLPVADARAISDRIHDLCDRIEQQDDQC
ncbi:MAG: hypothetical protein LBE67_16840 [Kocuria palustris]|uniref:hypothetical protein n=1 Tax=Kocuria palustris TaxID=71999 RepID=UPI001E0BE38B|nr:hypothetical protein [Kocuria palustris]MBZ6376589.1 hypothetical protein [Kocuria palustris]